VPQRVDAQTFIIDAYEHRKLAKFETFFNITVWFACFPPDEPHLPPVPEPQPCRPARHRAPGKATVVVPLTQTKVVDDRRDLVAALMGAISLR
jgi:hypothetical protein